MTSCPYSGEVIQTLPEPSDAEIIRAIEAADLDKTVDWAVFGRHWNSGQLLEHTVTPIELQFIRTS
ncbi:hypothetical protein [Parasphingorhabdus sp.]|uniref:hypothetical protein n=1 Tax=Parasphingorhabdus sp. TaxID=2709688 RepID=UPI003A916D8A